MKNQNSKNTNENRCEKGILLPNEQITKLIEKSHYQESSEQFDNADLNINHLENVFTDETYYLAMKIVPLLERKVLYLSYVENVRLNNICKRLKLQKNQVIRLKAQGIKHFKNNLATLYKYEKIRKGGAKKWRKQL